MRKAATHFGKNPRPALLQALMLYLLHEAPPSEQNFGMVMEMLESAEVREEDESYQSPLDVLFERLEEREPDRHRLQAIPRLQASRGAKPQSRFW